MIPYAYNTQRQPPAPFVLVILKDPVSGAEVQNVPAQLDTAADRTLVPLALLEALGLVPVGTMTIGGVGGTTEEMPLYIVSLAIRALPAQLVRVVAHPDKSWVLLGARRLERASPGSRCPEPGPGNRLIYPIGGQY